VRGRELIEPGGKGSFIGVVEHASFEERIMEPCAGDTVVFSTDGFSDARNIRGESFESCGMREELSAHAGMDIRNYISRLYGAARIPGGPPLRG
jgi:serine phosphatase RsbU (regulator of sigma subunit)